MSVTEPGPEHVQSTPASPGIPALAQGPTMPEIGQEGSRRLLILGVGLAILVVAAAVALFAFRRTGPG